MAEIRRDVIVDAIRKIARHVRPEILVPCIFGICEVWNDHLMELYGHENIIKWSIDFESREIIFSIYDEHGDEVKRLDYFRF